MGKGLPKNLNNLRVGEKDLKMFTIKNLTLSKSGNLVKMEITLKRNMSKELLTTFLPMVLLLLVTFTSIFFDKSMFGDALAINLTIMLVMTTIFTSKIEELHPSSDTKMIDIWMIGCLLVPFTEVVLRTVIEVLGNCDHCKLLGEEKASEDERRNKQRTAWDFNETSSDVNSFEVKDPLGLSVISKKGLIKTDTHRYCIESCHGGAGLPSYSVSLQ